jgi:F-type H+-transporting ATPase subunit b
MNLVTPGLGLIFWQLVTFLIVVFVLSRVAWKPILTMIKEREDSIETALDAAKQARAEMESLKSSNEDLLKEARLEREKMIREAQTTANAIVAEAQDKARTETTRLLEDARLSIQSEKASALADIRNQVADLSIAIAEKVMKEHLSNDASQQALVARYLDEAKTSIN